MPGTNDHPAVLTSGSLAHPVTMVPGDAIWQPGMNTDLKKDWFDRRDVIYAPSLRPLGRGTRTIRPLRVSATASLRIAIRNQQNDATCSGQALAALIDILRAIAEPESDLDPVSARMLYVLGREVEATRAGEGVQTLRSVVKGFWHNSVCSEYPCWPYLSDDHLTVERAKAARAVPLSTYFRVRTLLSDFHVRHFGSGRHSGVRQGS